MKSSLRYAIEEMNARQCREISDTIVHWMIKAFDAHQEEMNERLREIYTALQGPGDIQTKLKLSVPLINHLGIHLETEVDVKSWAGNMYQKYGAKLFQLLG